MSQDVQHLANRSRILKPVNELGNISYARINDLQPGENGASDNPTGATLTKNKMIKSSERLEKYQKAK